VAALQQAMLGRCTLFPLMLGGEAKAALLLGFRQAASGAAWQYSAEAKELQAALLALPCDAQQEPCTAADAARRALACLPETTVFAAVAECRQTLQAALDTAQQMVSAPF
jgi:hypothetical protein